MVKKLQVIIVKRLSKEMLTLELTEIEDSLKVFYDIIGCRSIDIIERYYNNRHFDIICDDEGLLVAEEKNEEPTSWWSKEGYTPNKEGLFGTLILCHHDEEGNLQSLERNELEDIRASYFIAKDHKGRETALLFHDVERR